MLERDYPAHVRRPPQNMRRARGNLSYLQFVRLVDNFWSQAHPDVPIIPTGGNDVAHYPCIMYGLELRRSHDNDPKPRYRETVSADDGSAVVIIGQRFLNVVSFTACAETSTGGAGAVLAEEIIEAFEDFMQEMTPVLKEMGASELVYSRRYADSEFARSGEGVVMRKVAYALTTEKIITTEVERINTMVVKAQVASSRFTSHDESSKFQYKPPKYYSFNNKPPYFYITPDDLSANLITIPYSGFVLGDQIYLKALNTDQATPGQYPFPEDLTVGEYVISNVVGEPYSSVAKYEISKADFFTGDLTQVTSFGAGGSPDDDGREYYGLVYYLPAPDVSGELVDTFAEPV